MKRSRRFEVSALEGLEDRVVLSQMGVGVAKAAAVAHIRQVRLERGPATIGVLGDSLSDEYAFYPPDRSQARNWVELLANRRAFFGPFRIASRGEPRDGGFAFNWARSDSTTSDLVANQLPGLARQVEAGLIRYAVVLSGDNDFVYFLRDEAIGLASNPTALRTRLGQVLFQAETNIDTAVNTLLAANPNVRVVVGTVFDITRTPRVQNAAAQVGPGAQPLLEATSQAITSFNTHIRNLAAGNDRIALADLAAGQDQATAAGPTASIGGVTISLTTQGNNYHNFLLADDYHPGTVAQGLIADTIIGALDSGFHANVLPLFQTQILHLARNARRIP